MLNNLLKSLRSASVPIAPEFISVNEFPVPGISGSSKTGAVGNSNAVSAISAWLKFAIGGGPGASALIVKVSKFGGWLIAWLGLV